ncbi:MAG TPA: hypothetical protein DCL15_01005 [Chloroflexi bacterium]|nr:hypothetical protein [Chloroflexota bacterium]HHW85459.1 hypothetical protein [Chloroflexota bacterium]
MNGFNRFVAIVLWFVLLAGLLVAAIAPLQSVAWLQATLTALSAWMTVNQADNPAYFIVGQAAVGIGAILILGALLFFEVSTMRRRGVRIRTLEGGAAELDTISVERRLQWHLDQVADVITVVPAVRARGGSVDIKLEIEAAPDIDIPLKTDEVVEVTRDIIEQDMGLRLGKLDVQLRCAPFEPEWNA